MYSGLRSVSCVESTDRILGSIQGTSYPELERSSLTLRECRSMLTLTSHGMSIRRPVLCAKAGPMFMTSNQANKWHRTRPLRVGFVVFEVFVEFNLTKSEATERSGISRFESFDRICDVQLSDPDSRKDHRPLRALGI